MMYVVPFIIVIAAPIVLLPLIFLWFRRMVSQLGQKIAASGETILVEPQIGLYQGSIGGVISPKTQGAIALTDRRIVFRQPLGKDIEVPIPQIAELSKNKWFKGNYRGGREFMIVKRKDGSEVAFMVKDPDKWMEQIAHVQGLENR